MSHRFAVLDKEAQWEPFKEPYLASGGQWPAEGSALMFAEFDEQDNPVACQFLQVGIFAEGMWARDGSAHLRTLWNMLIGWVQEQNKGKTVSLLTMTKSDETGERIARAVQKKMKFEDTGWKVFRRILSCQ